MVVEYRKRIFYLQINILFLEGKLFLE